MILIKCGNYVLRDWENGDWAPKHFQGSYTLMFNDKQVGAIAGAIFEIHRIDVEPRCCGHGTKFIELVMKAARKRGHREVKIQGVFGDTSRDKEALQHILRDKLNFEQMDEETWRKLL